MYFLMVNMCAGYVGNMKCLVTNMYAGRVGNIKCLVTNMCAGRVGNIKCLTNMYAGCVGNMKCLVTNMCAGRVGNMKCLVTNMETTINITARIITCITVYKHELSDIHKYTMSTFFTEFQNLLTYYILTKDELLL